MAHRLSVLEAHLAGASESRIESCNAAAAGCPHAAEAAQCPYTANRRDDVTDYVERLAKLRPKLRMLWEKKKDSIDQTLWDKLPGPYHRGMTEDEKFAALEKWFDASMQGVEHILAEEYTLKYGKQGLSSNIVMITVRTTRPDSSPRKIIPTVHQSVLVSNPDDCLRLAQKHVKKSSLYLTGFQESVISTQDNELWKAQRDVLTKAFMPRSSLAKVFPISRERASRAGNILLKLTEYNTPIDMNEFYLHEANAQLRLAMFGESPEVMEEINRGYRFAMDGKVEDQLPQLRKQFRFMRDNIRNDVATGPLVGAIKEATERANSMDQKLTNPTFFGNLSIFSFAGHDTTGNTMTFLTYELARHPEYQKRLQQEVDQLWDTIARENRTFEYDDFFKLPFMTRCIMETLRLWPAVGNGTFRELESDDWVTGPQGEQVWLPKGTHIQLFTWSRHRNPDLWGPDAHVFNPDRTFEGREMWDGEAFSAANPYSKRFSPFTFPPRDCIGKNFSQMEMRLIFLHVFRVCEFSLLPDAPFEDPNQTGVNYGTIAPRDTTKPMQARKFISPVGKLDAKTPNGLLLTVKARQR